MSVAYKNIIKLPEIVTDLISGNDGVGKLLVHL